ncbi:MAG: hypothetical protein AAF634_10880 [Bacteroidota bacterium]
MKLVKHLLVMALLTGAIAFGQRQEKQQVSRLNDLKELSVEQLATLKTKKMTLALDLNEKQQEQIMDFHLEHIAFRKNKMEELQQKRAAGALKKPTAEERYAMENARLDRMIAQQETLKKILNTEQYEQWKKVQLYKQAQVHQHRKVRKQSRRG